MTVLKRNFIKGRMNKDLDERLVPNGEYRDALNVEVLTSEGSDVGSLQTSWGNSKLSEITLPGQECVGSIADEKNNKIYWFVAGNSFSIKPYPNNNIHEVHQDLILEYDIATDTITPVLVDNYTVQTTLVPGTNSGVYGEDPNYLPVLETSGLRPAMTLKVYDSSGNILNPPFYGVPGIHSLTASYTVPNQELIVRAIPSANEVWLNLDITIPSGEEDKLNLVFESPRTLNFDKSKMITGINIVDGMLFWTDNNSEPKKINIARCKEGNASYLQPYNQPDNDLNSTALVVNGIPQEINWMQSVPINPPWGYPKIISEEDITVIKRSPLTPPTLELRNWVGHDSNFIGNFVLNPLYDEAGTQVGVVNESPVPIEVGSTKSIVLSNQNIRYQPGTTLLIQQSTVNNGVVDENNYNVKAKVVSGLATITTPAVTTLVTTVSSANTAGYGFLVDPPNTAIQAGQLVTGTDSSGNPLVNSAVPFGVSTELFVHAVIQFGPGIGQLVMLEGNNIGWQPGGTTYSASIPPGTLTNLEFWDYTPPITVSDNHWLKILEIGSVTTNDNENWKIIEEPNDKVFEFKFPKFAYRYKYEDGEYSVMSPFSEVAFLPHEDGFDYHPKKGYNLGMTNGCTGVVVGSWNPVDKPFGVKEIQVLYKESNSPIIYAVQNFTENDWEWNQSIYAKGVDTRNNGYLHITAKTVHHAIESNQILRPWDNVPRKALAQEITGNRLVYGNYLQSYNQEVDNISFETSVQSYPITGVSNRTGNSTALKSLKSFREYQIGVVYRDKYGREMPVLSTSSSLVKIQKDFSRYSNVLEAKINHPPPSWATSFKYFVKETSNQYHNLAIDRYYNASDDAIWLSFPSEDRNKVDETTTIILKKGHDEDRDVKVPQERFKILSIKNEAPEFIKMTRQSLGTLQTNSQQTVTSGSFFKSPGGNIGVPLNGINYFYLDIEDHLGGSNPPNIPVPGWEGSPFAYLQTRANDGVFENRLTTNVSYQVRFKTSITVSGLSGKTKWYDISSITYSSTNEMEIHTGENFEDDIDILLIDPDSEPSANNIRSGIQIEIARLTSINRAEFEGRFFVKVHKSSVITKHILKTSTEEDVVVRSQQTRFASRNHTTDGDGNPEPTPKYILRYNPDDFTGSSFNYITHAPKIVGVVEENASGKNEAHYFNGPSAIATTVVPFPITTYIDYQTQLNLAVGAGVNHGYQTSSLGVGGVSGIFGGTSSGATRDTTNAPGSGVWINKWASEAVLTGSGGNADWCVPYPPSSIWLTWTSNSGRIQSRLTPSDESLDEVIIKGDWFIDMEPTYQVLTDNSNKYQHVKNSLGYNNHDNSEYGNEDKHWEIFSDTGIGALPGSTKMDISFSSWVMDPSDTEAFNDPGKWDLVRDCPKAKPMVDQLKPGKKFRWAEDPDDNIYTILMVKKSYHFNYGMHPGHNEDYPNWRSASNACHHYRKRARFRLTLDKAIGAINADDYVPTDPPNTSGAARKGRGANLTSKMATMIFLENRLDEYVEMSDNPAIFETEPKEDLGLDIYYEVGQAFPIRITDDTNNQYIKPGATLPYIFNSADPKKITRTYIVNYGGTPNSLLNYPAGPGSSSSNIYLNSSDGIEIGMVVFGSVYENNDPSGNILENVLISKVTDINAVSGSISATGLSAVYESVKLGASVYAPTYTNSNIVMTRKMIVPGSEMVFTNLPVVEKVEANSLGPYEKNGIKTAKITTSIPLSTTYLQYLPLVGDSLTFRNPDGYEVTTTVAETNQEPFNKIYVSSMVHGQTQQLQYSNCYSFGNGVESNRIKDLFNEVFIDKGVKASTTIELPFEEDRRSNSLIFSGIYNSVSETNNLNQFIVAEDITKSLSPIYGSLQKLHSRDTDLIALCEDKVLKILANKDALYNADDSRNITANPNVLGQSISFIGEYGISKNPESFVSREFRAYFTDVQRGAVMRLSRDGLTPISEHGMKDWFRDNLASTSNQVVQDPYLTNSDHWETSHALITEDYSGVGVLAGVDANAGQYSGFYQGFELVHGREYTFTIKLSEVDEGGDTTDTMRYIILGRSGGVNSYRPLIQDGGFGGPTATNGTHTHVFTFDNTENNNVNFMMFYLQFTNGDAYTKSVRIEHVSLVETGGNTTKVIGSYDSRKSLYNVSVKRDSAAPTVTEKLGPELIANGSLTTEEFWDFGENWEYEETPFGHVKANSVVVGGWENRVKQIKLGVVDGKTYRIKYTVSGYSNGKVRLLLYGNTYEYHSLNRDADGEYIEYVRLEEGASGVSSTGSFNNQIHFTSFDSAFTGEISNISVREVTEVRTDSNNKTVSFSEASKGWVSFKSYIPESGLSINNEFYTFKNGNIWRHHSNSVRNNFYDTQYDSSINVLFNDSPEVVKTFNTLSYMGSQSKISANLKDNNHYNLAEKEGWYINSLTTDMQKGKVKDFKEKEGMWFNYIQGLETTINNLNTKEFSIQGIGKPSIVGIN